MSGQRGSDNHGPVRPIVAVAAAVFSLVHVEQDQRVQRDGRLEILDQQVFGVGADFPVDMAQRVAGPVVTDAGGTGRVLEEALATGQNAKGQAGGQVEPLQGNDTGVDGQVVGRDLALVLGEAKEIPRREEHGTQTVVAAAIGANLVGESHGASPADGDGFVTARAQAQVRRDAVV